MQKRPELRFSAYSKERVGLEHWLNTHQHKGPELQLRAEVSEIFSDSTSDTKPYGISEEDLRAEECVVPNPENIEDEIRLLCSSNDKDTPQAEEEDAENAFLEDISQELSVKEAIGKPLNSSKLA